MTWRVRKDKSNCIDIERIFVDEEEKLEAYELCAYISLKDGSLNPVTGRKVPDKILNKARILQNSEAQNV